MFHFRLRAAAGVIGIALLLAACGAERASDEPGATETGSTLDVASPDDAATTIDDSLPPVRLANVILDTAGFGSLSGTETSDDTAEENSAAAEAEFDALVDWANGEGGVDGRRIEAETFHVSLEEAVDENALLQRCVEITEDYGAEYVVDTSAFIYPTSQECFAEHGTVLVAVATALSEGALAELSPFVATTWPTLEDQFQALGQALAELDFVGGGTVGVYLEDNAAVSDAYDAALAPALDAAGIAVAETASVQPTDQAEQASAVLAFQEAGVDHVIFVGNVLGYLGFSGAAEAQGYRPRYAFPDYQLLAPFAAILGAAAQVSEAVQVSSCQWISCVPEDSSRSSTDLTSEIDVDAASPGLTRCIETLSEARGESYETPSTAGASQLFPTVCDNFLLWLDASRAAGSEVTPETWGQGLEALGDGYESVMAHQTDFSSGRLAGSVDFAAGVFDPTCACFPRVTEWRPLG